MSLSQINPLVMTESHGTTLGESSLQNTAAGCNIFAIVGKARSYTERKMVNASIENRSPSLQNWIKSSLPCAFGRMEYIADRYAFSKMSSQDDLDRIITDFRSNLRAGDRSALIVEFSGEIANDLNCQTAKSVVEQLEKLFQMSEGVPTLANGGVLSFVELCPCPVTNRVLPFTFFGIAFYPQASNAVDPLFDPSLYAPKPCVNFTSDALAFSHFVASHSMQLYGHRPYELTADARNVLFEASLARWQKLSERTIRSFGAVSGCSERMIRLAPDCRTYIAFHQDPSFAEIEKEEYNHDMPVVYLPPLISLWNTCLANAILPTTAIQWGQIPGKRRNT